MSHQLILTLDAALDGAGAAVVCAGSIVAERRHAGQWGTAGVLPSMAEAVLSAAQTQAPALAAIAVTIGPGSFTGIRAALALAHGIGTAAAVPVFGASIGDVLRQGLPGGQRAWVAVDSKRGRIFLDDGDTVRTLALDAVPAAMGPVVIAGDAAEAVAASLRSRGQDAVALAFGGLDAVAIAEAAYSVRRPALPLYLDPPEARPAAPARPGPAGH